MTKPVYYNEFDPAAAAWLRGLIAAGLIAPGEVDERSITDVRPDDLRGFGQCHFFAGIGGWSLALRLAGVLDDRPVWTGSCPCQPFSAAGKQRGAADERHLWPAFFRLIRECRPVHVFGEQVAGAAGYAWFDHVAADLEREGYAAAACDIGAHSVGAPHIRQRLYWVADASGWRREQHRHPMAGTTRGSESEAQQRQRLWLDAGHGGELGRMADADQSRRRKRVQCDGEPQQPGQSAPCGRDPDGRGEVCGAGNADDARLEGRCNVVDRRGELGHADGMHAEQSARQGPRPDETQGAGPCGEPARSGDDGVSLVNAQRAGLEGHRPDQVEGGWHQATGSVAAPGAPDWRNLKWIPCADGKARPTESTVQWLDDGLSGELGYRRNGDRLVLSLLVQGSKNRIARLRGYGNAIVPALAAEFLMAFFDAID